MPGQKTRKKKSSFAKQSSSRRRTSDASTISTISGDSEAKTPENRITHLPPTIPQSVSKIIGKNGDLLNDISEDSFTAHGLLYQERLDTFFAAHWPYMNTKDACHPHHLAMAGFVFHSLEPTPAAECFVCFNKIEDLRRNSDPWILHCTVNPECALVKLGFPEKPDAYTMNQVLDLCKTSWDNKYEKLSTYCENFLLEKLQKIAETEDVATDDDSWRTIND